MGVSAPWCPRDLPHVFPWEEGWSIPLSKGRLWNTAAAIRSSSSFPPSVTLSYGSFPRASICNHLCDSGMQTARTRKQPSFLETSAQACPSVELWLILLWEKKVPFHICTNMTFEFLNHDYLGIHFGCHIVFWRAAIRLLFPISVWGLLQMELNLIFHPIPQKTKHTHLGSCFICLPDTF